MLLGFEFNNWKSFRKKSSFSMYASKERQHGDRITVIPKFNLRISPIGLIFGGNASGKSCFVSAIKFVQDFVLYGEKVLSTYTPFLFSNANKDGPSEFSIQLYIDDLIYDYTFSVNHNRVLKEELTKTNSKSTYVLFKRNKDKIEVDPEKTIKEDDRDTLNVFAKGTKPNRLFLTNSIDQQMKTWAFLYKWFKEKLLIIFPNTSIDPFAILNQPDLIRIYSEELSTLDTGILQVDKESIDLKTLKLPPDLIEKVNAKLEENTQILLSDPNGNKIVIKMINGKLTATQLVSIHKTLENNSISLSMSDESDGTKRMLDLIPALSMLTSPDSEMVVIVDEIDRSLHSKMSIHLLKQYLASCGQHRRAQLIFTTHDMMLMDQKMFRRDEMWLVEKDPHSESELICMSDYKDIRYDKDIRKSYLEGRMGGINIFHKKTKSEG